MALSKEVKQDVAKAVAEENEGWGGNITLAPGFYVDNGEMNGPYTTAADAQAFSDGHLGGKGHIVEVTAENGIQE